MTDPRIERPDPAPQDDFQVSRRGFLKGAGGALTGGALSAAALAQGGAAAQTQAAEAAEGLSGELPLVLEINGQRRQIQVEPRTTLLSALRHRCEPALTGSKEVCGRGNCGACTVLIDGQPAYSCLVLAVEAEGRAVTTVEGLGSPEALSEVQAAFCDKDALMCGFCTPGFVVAATALLARSPAATRPEIVSGLCGNLCRCGTYPHVFDAVEVARDRLAARAPQGGAR